MAGELLRVNTAEYQRAVRKLKKVGPAIERKLRRTIRQAAKPLGEDMVGGIADRAPQGGGLADRIRQRGTFAATFQKKGLEVALRPFGRWKAKQFEYPPFRHPVRGNRSVWVDQSKGMEGGGADAAFTKDADKLQNDIANAAVQAVKEAL